MATYTELFNQGSDSAFRNKVSVAVCVAADGIRVEDVATANHANRLIWAKRALENPRTVAENMHFAILVANKDLTVAQIQGASDVAIQSNVDACVDVFAQG